VRDYSINQVGPAEVTEAQVDEANKRRPLPVKVVWLNLYFQPFVLYV